MESEKVINYKHYTQEELAELCARKDLTIFNQRESLALLQKAYKEQKDINLNSTPKPSEHFGIEPNTRCFVKTFYKTFEGNVSAELKDHIKLETTDGEGNYFYLIRKSSIVALKTFYKNKEN